MSGSGWATLLAVAVVAAIVFYGSGLATKTHEGFAVAPRGDTGEPANWQRDLRYAATATDIQGVGVAADFCRAVARRGEPDSLCLACDVGSAPAMAYRSRSVREGFRFSRDDYWRRNPTTGRMDYCRVLRDPTTGEHYPVCAVAGPTGFAAQEERDVSPPPAIRQLLEAYEGVRVWWRWFDDAEDSAGNVVAAPHGRPELPAAVGEGRQVSRGLQLNRAATATGPPRDYLRWGEPGSTELALEGAVPPRQIRAIAFWIWWDAFEAGARGMECATRTAEGHGQPRDLMWIGIEGGGPAIPAAPPRDASPALEVRPAAAPLNPPAEPWIIVGEEPRTDHSPGPTTATYVFEIWDGEQRIMRLASPAPAAATGRWQHVVVTTAGPAADWWPTWQMWVDGALVATRTDGRLSPAMALTENYIGRNVRGCIQDFRVYDRPMPADKIAAAIRWGRPRLHPAP